MTSRFNVRNLVLCLSLSVFFSCKKDDNPTPTPPPAQPTLFEQVQGRWNATFQAPPRISNPAVSFKQQDMGYITSVEVFSDSSYVLVFDSQYAITGKLSVTDSASVNFNGFASASNVKVSADSISFTCVLHEDYTMDVKAAKAADLTINAENKPLVSKDWTLTREEDGNFLYAMQQANEDAILSFYFSPAGTFLIKHSQMGYHAMFRNWRWHPELSNAVQSYSYDIDEVEYSSYFKIVSITTTKLVVKEIGTVEGEPQEERTYVFTAQ